VNRTITKERLAAFSDGVFAVIITIMVLQLRLPSHPSFEGLLAQWPTALSYVVSYILIVIMWINHHFLWGFAKHSTPKLILWNFLHIFAASLVPFATAWVADTHMASVPVFVYAAVIVLVNLTYHGFAYEVVPRAQAGEPDHALRRTALTRSTVTLALFSIAMFLSLRFPLVAFAMVTCVLITYARPEIPRSHGRVSVE
jgi:TMEM175 potassium channel family protein